jgi:hypothetical protein
MNALLLSAFLQFGMLSGGAVMYEPPEQILVTDFPAYATLGVRADYGLFFAEGSIRTDMRPISLSNWIPNQITYDIGGGMTYKMFTLGYRRTCYHPVTPYMVYGGYAVIPAFEGATDDIYLRINIGGKR